MIGPMFKWGAEESEKFGQGFKKLLFWVAADFLFLPSELLFSKVYFPKRIFFKDAFSASV